MIENYNKQIAKIYIVGVSKINYLNINSQKIPFSEIASLEKGLEVGSNNYIANYNKGVIHYIRVGDLNSLTNTYINKDLKSKIAKSDDILIAFDGDPGRNSIGLNGAYSSGIYKVISDNINKGLVYFEINSDLNQKIIKDNSQGTTILHASKAIPHLQIIDVSDSVKNELNELYELIVNIKQKVKKLEAIKLQLLNKYFTNQQ